MGLFDSIFGTKSDNTAEVKKTEKGGRSISFAAVPASIDEFKALPQSALSTPFDTAALTVLALCVYPKDREQSLEMLQYLRGPRPMSQIDIQFIRDRFMDKDYVPRSFFDGATPQNDYTPSTPYTIKITENPYSYATENMAKLFVKSGGADSERPIEIRLAKDCRWYLWEQYILSGIREPESSNPWA